ncbi:MAG TPA: cytochrome c biogenesis CcdA family protein [Anaerolineae bacterium]|nr:cytochrome c biogenesis CcdA family protein [Anaerolineae bacterium]
MQESLPKPFRSLTQTQWTFLILGFLLVCFIVIGTITQSRNGETETFLLGAQPFAVLAILAFVGGLFSFISPCTLPVLTAYFAFAFQSGRSQIAANTGAFMLGLATTFTILGAGAFALGQLFYNNQFLIMLISGALIIIFGVMSILGKGFTGVQGSDGGAQPQSTTLGGSYLFGLTFAVGWSSCVGPILGTVLTLAAQTTTVYRGMMLLFIYTIGLGLPLIIVSTFFGRLNRNSWFWRLLRGKGWEWNAPVAIISLIWALALWQIAIGVTQYMFNFTTIFGPQVFGPLHQYGLLALAIFGALLWTFTSQDKKITVHLHSTQILSGVLFIAIGILMLNGRLAAFSELAFTQDFALIVADWEEVIISFFNP